MLSLRQLSNWQTGTKSQAALPALVTQAVPAYRGSASHWNCSLRGHILAHRPVTTDNLPGHWSVSAPCSESESSPSVSTLKAARAGPGGTIHAEENAAAPTVPTCFRQGHSNENPNDIGYLEADTMIIRRIGAFMPVHIMSHQPLLPRPMHPKPHEEWEFKSCIPLDRRPRYASVAHSRLPTQISMSFAAPGLLPAVAIAF